MQSGVSGVRHDFTRFVRDFGTFRYSVGCNNLGSMRIYYQASKMRRANNRSAKICIFCRQDIIANFCIVER